MSIAFSLNNFIGCTHPNGWSLCAQLVGPPIIEDAVSYDIEIICKKKEVVKFMNKSFLMRTCVYLLSYASMDHTKHILFTTYYAI